MIHHNPPQAPCPSDKPGDARTSPAPTGREGPRRTAGTLGYAFDPVPWFLAGLIREGKLLPIDELVLKHLLRFRRRVKDSCWASKATIAREIGRSTRTVQRSFDRLGRAGVVEQRPTAAPDPDDPSNRTGWRIVFLWLAPESYRPGPGPVRAGKGARKAPRGETSASPPPSAPPETSVSPPPETSVSPKYARVPLCVLDGLKSDETSSSSSSACAPARPTPPERSDDDDRASLPGGAGTGAAVPASPERPALALPKPAAPTPEEVAPTPEEVARLKEEARRAFPDHPGPGGRAAAFAERYGLQWTAWAIGWAVHKRARSFRYVEVTLAQWAADPGKAEPPPGPRAPIQNFNPPKPQAPEPAPEPPPTPEMIAEMRRLAVEGPTRVLRAHFARELAKLDGAATTEGAADGR